MSDKVEPFPFSIASEIPSPSLSVSYGLLLPVVSVLGGVKPPLAVAGTPLLSTAPSAFPSLSASVPLDSVMSLIPSPSESKSKRFGIPSPSVSQSTADGLHAAASTVSKIPSLSSSVSTVSTKPSPSLSNGQPFKSAVPTTNGHWSTSSKTPSSSLSKSK